MPPDRKYYTPPEAGRIIRMKPERVIGFIKAGELKASNLATRLGGRPRYRIADADLQAFLDRRAAVVAPPAAKPVRRSRETANVTDATEFY